MDKHVILEECLQEISFVKSRLSLLEERLHLILQEEVEEAQAREEEVKEELTPSAECQEERNAVEQTPVEEKMSEQLPVELIEVEVEEEVVPVATTTACTEEKEKKTVAVKQTAVDKPCLDARLIPELRKAIGLNDRFRFKRELFRNSDELMLDTIDALDKMSSLAQAQAYLQENFDWEEEDACVLYFTEMLQRRFYHS